MRNRLAVLVFATTSLVLIAFLVPLGYLVQQVAADRAINAATREAEGLAPVVATVERDVLRLTLAQVGADDAEDYPLTVFLPDGTVMGAKAERSKAVELAARGRSVVVDSGDGREVLVAVQGVDEGTAVVRSLVPADALHQGVVRAWAILGMLGIVLLALSVVVADRLARALVRPMHELADVSHRLSAGDLDARVHPSGPAELRDVGRAINHLAGRIKELLTLEREGVADLSHRLRTPLTALRLDAEMLADPSESARLTADIDALTATVDRVIDEARRPMREGVGAGCDAAHVIRERLAFWSVLAEEEGRAVDTAVAAGPIMVAVNESDMAAAIDALLGNVFSHTASGTDFWVGLDRTDGEVRLTVADAGPGFTGEDPFGRGSSASASTGLGLNIVRCTAEASGGHVETAPPDRFETGATIVVVLGAIDP